MSKEPEKTNEVTPDPRHDTLISNPEYREAFNNAINAGLSEDEAHEYAHVELSGGSERDDKQANTVDSEAEQLKSDIEPEGIEGYADQKNPRDKCSSSGHHDEDEHRDVKFTLADFGRPTTRNNRERTLEEQRILDRVAERKGKEYVEKHAGLILAQARLVGEL